MGPPLPEIGLRKMTDYVLNYGPVSLRLNEFPLLEQNYFTLPGWSRPFISNVHKEDYQSIKFVFVFKTTTTTTYIKRGNPSVVSLLTYFDRLYTR